MTQTGRLADALGLHHHLQAGPPAPIRHRNLGVISRWPITAHNILSLPTGGQPDEHRIALRVTIATPTGNLPMITTHLNWRLDHSAVRQAQVRHIAAAVTESDEDESEEIRMLTGLTTLPIPGVVFQDAWLTAGDGSPGHTWDHGNPHAATARLGPARIDYLFVRWHPDQAGPIQQAT